MGHVDSENLRRPNRTIVYIDGFNLYFGMRERGLQHLYWLDMTSLARGLLESDQQLIHTKYFTARISGPPDKQRRQSNYLEALASLPGLSIVYGRYFQIEKRCTRCCLKHLRHEEKMTDVNIAVSLLGDAWDNAFDTAVVVSADSDLVPALTEVRRRCPSKRLVAAFPPCRGSDFIRPVVHAHRRIRVPNLTRAQLPESVVTPSGQAVSRPEEWRLENLPPRIV